MVAKNETNCQRTCAAFTTQIIAKNQRLNVQKLYQNIP
jgi:hypothetical protein